MGLFALTLLTYFVIRPTVTEILPSSSVVEETTEPTRRPTLTSTPREPKKASPRPHSTPRYDAPIVQPPEPYAETTVPTHTFTPAPMVTSDPPAQTVVPPDAGQVPPLDTPDIPPPAPAPEEVTPATDAP